MKHTFTHYATFKLWLYICTCVSTSLIIVYKRNSKKDKEVQWWFRQQGGCTVIFPKTIAAATLVIPDSTQYLPTTSVQKVSISITSGCTITALPSCCYWGTYILLHFPEELPPAREELMNESIPLSHLPYTLIKINYPSEPFKTQAKLIQCYIPYHKETP